MATPTSTTDLYKPVIFDMSVSGAYALFKKYLQDREEAHAPLQIVDDYVSAKNEFLLLEHPEFLLKEATARPVAVLDDHAGTWIVFPWKNIAVHTLSKEEFLLLRLSRNHDLITKEEQERLRARTIGIAGLNVGNPAAICLAQEGIGSTFFMADNDTLSLSNLNRFRAGLPELGMNKAVLSARQAMEINPFLNITVWENGITPDRVEEFVRNSEIVIEEVDHLPLKIALREEAKRQRKPVIMVTGNGHDIILDIERFDEEPELPLLSGKLEQSIMAKIAEPTPPSFSEKIILARDFMGKQYLAPRLYDSFPKVGQTLIGIPQLAEATFLRGAVLTHVARGILLGEKISSGRYTFGLSDLYTKRT